MSNAKREIDPDRDIPSAPKITDAEAADVIQKGQCSLKLGLKCMSDYVYLYKVCIFLLRFPVVLKLLVFR